VAKAISADVPSAAELAVLRRELATVSAKLKVQAAADTAIAKAEKVATDGYCSPRHRMPFKSRSEGLKACDDVASTIHQSLGQGRRRFAAQGHSHRSKNSCCRRRQCCGGRRVRQRGDVRTDGCGTEGVSYGDSSRRHGRR